MTIINAQLAGDVEYTACFSADGLELLTTSVLDMTLNFIWWWSSSSGALGKVEYSFMAITPRSTLNRSGTAC